MMFITFGNPDDPDISVILPRSFWQDIQTMLESEKDIFPHGSEEHERVSALITSIRNQTGVEPDWSQIP